jgi:ribosomal protein L7/L12
VLPSEAISALERGELIAAIRLVRQSTGLDLKDSKDAVDAYLAAHPALRERNAIVSAEGVRQWRVLLVSIAFVAAALALLLWLRSTR